MTPTETTTPTGIAIGILAFLALGAYLYPLLRRVYRIHKIKSQTPAPLLGVVYPDKDKDVH